MVESAISKSGHLEIRKYFRRWMRNSVHIAAKVDVVTLDGRTFTSGTAVIRDVSLRGARLGRLSLKKPCLPIEAFRIRLTFTSRQYQGMGAVCRPIRFGRGTEFELAVEFEDFWAKTGS
jgi:hypothetical protein